MRGRTFAVSFVASLVVSSSTGIARLMAFDVLRPRGDRIHKKPIANTAFALSLLE